MEIEQLIEDIKSIRNECDIILNLSKCSWETKVRYLYPTVLENIYVKIQELLDETCIVNK